MIGTTMKPAHLLFAASALALMLAAPATARTLPDSFDVGRGPQGELCRAQRVWNDPAATGLFDTVYAVRCRGWTDTASVGRVGLFTAGAAALAPVKAGVATRMACADPGAVTLPGIGAGEGARCRNDDGGYAAFAVTGTVKRQLVAIDGLERFSANLAATARAITGLAAAPGATAAPGAAIELANLAAAPAPTAGAAAQADSAGIASRRGEVIEYSVRGQHGEARELATRYLAQLPAATSAIDRADFTLEASLASSNLGYDTAAEAGFAQANALLTDLRGAAADSLRRKLMVYRALEALNRRNFAAALTAADAALAGESRAAEAAAAATPLANPAVLNQLNASSTRSALARRDQSWVAPTILQAQSHYARAVALRSLGRAGEAPAALGAANQLLARFDNSGFDASSLQWLRSAVAAEQGRTARQLKDLPGARAAFEKSVQALENSSVYAGTPLLGQRHIELANAALAVGDQAAARTAFDKGFAILRVLGPTTASSVGGLDAYFDLLVAQAAAGGPGSAEAKARFFEASQLVSPPAVASQIAQLQKIFESGTSDGAVRAKTLQDLDRESRALAMRLTVMAPDAPDRAALENELASLNSRAAAVRAELAGDQQYQQATESVASLDEMQKALRPGEAYLKLVTLTGRTHAMLVKADGATLYRTGADSTKLAALAQKVRSSIDGTHASDGRTLVLVFDVAAAHDLKAALLDGAGTALDGVTTLITEPSGAMTQLPFGVLVADQASVDAFAASVKKNSRDYTGVRFLLRDRRIDSAVSPRSFMISRSVAPSRATQPYIGLGNHQIPNAGELAALPTRGAFRGQCAAQADMLRAGFASLRPVGAAEIAAAQAAFGAGADAVEGAAFTDTQVDDKAGLGAKLRNYAVLHFATHGLKEGELDCDSPPALVTSIADTGDSDGLLSFEEIANLSLDANLVALSACNTAASTSSARTNQSGFRNEIGQAATLNGLARAFMVAGTRAVLATHWAIPDSFRARDGRTVEASTRLISQMFSLGRTGAMGDALRQAQMGMINNIDTSHPYYWGAFMLVGDGARPMLSNGSGTGQ
ncbi:MAG: CHAT domain-containing protein [Sphingomonadales bacterium]|jgi:CHAT domain-containing protein